MKALESRQRLQNHETGLALQADYRLQLLAQQQQQQTASEDALRNAVFALRQLIEAVPAALGTQGSDHLNIYLTLQDASRRTVDALSPGNFRSFEDKAYVAQTGALLDSALRIATSGWSPAASAAARELSERSVEVLGLIETAKHANDVPVRVWKPVPGGGGLKYGVIEGPPPGLNYSAQISALLAGLAKVQSLVGQIPGGTVASLPWATQYEFALQWIIAPLQKRVFAFKCLAFLARVQHPSLLRKETSCRGPRGSIVWTSEKRRISWTLRIK